MLFQEIYVKIDTSPYMYKSLVMDTSFKELVVIICVLLCVSKGLHGKECHVK